MKKLIFTIIGIFIAMNAYAFTELSLQTYVSPNDVTIAHMESDNNAIETFCNAIDGENIKIGTITPEQLDSNANPVTRWNEAFNDWVYTGLLPPTSATASATTTKGTAYISGNRVEKAATAHTYTVQKWTYVTLASNGTYTYDEKAIDATPTALASDNIRLARVSTDTTKVLAVLDQRILAISLDSHQEDFYRVGLQLSVTTPDAIAVSPGIVYWGTQRIQKITRTVLGLGVGGDWFDGGRASGKYGYVAINTDGLIQLTDVAPTLHDLAGTTLGKKYYTVDAGDSSNWRVLGWFRMQGGAGDIAYNNWGNFKDEAIDNITYISRDNDVLTTSTSPVQLDDMTTYFYNSGNSVHVVFNAPVKLSAAPVTWLYVDGVSVAKTKSDGAAAAVQTSYLSYVSKDDQGGHTYQVYWNSFAAGTSEQQGATNGPRALTVMEL